MRPAPVRCGDCARDHHTWGPADTEPERDVTAWTVRLTRRHCVCRCRCGKSETTVVARARRADPPTAYLPLAGSLDLERERAVLLAPTVPRHRLPAVAMFAADLLPHRPQPVRLARPVVPFAATRPVHRPLPSPDLAVMERVLTKLHQLPTKGPKHVPPTNLNPGPPS
ncbi:hypothetical protein NQK81_02045 [Amycolatopsis roodepoortensis]|uniref:hypothetical protein n=1 Tax=Amycolatopsis roodepoortensis TaxID=700274 RepID=UPI00214CF48F|nr:hypothetical protein [Amycolatopsis roodepoortensis]UUV32256.1 hypothetical protein NQK81_02045 [Amycolatopsis roodepoortensis]